VNGREGKGEFDGVGNTNVVAVGCDDDDVAWLGRGRREEGKDTGMNDVSTGATVSSSCKGQVAVDERPRSGDTRIVRRRGSLGKLGSKEEDLERGREIE